MRDVSQYFELIENAVEYSPATEAEIEILRFDAKSGLIEGVLYFADGSRLEFTERVVIEQRRLVKQEYRYQFVRNEEAVFRYDNACLSRKFNLATENCFLSPKPESFPFSKERHSPHSKRHIILSINPRDHRP